VGWGASWQRWRVEVLIDVEKEDREERQHLCFFVNIEIIDGKIR
jgi:hypothetical protein